MGMDPASWAAIGMMAANTVRQGMNQQSEAGAQEKAARRQADYAMAVADRDAAMHERQAALDKKLAQADMRRKTSASRVGAVGSGIDLGSGSALEVLSGAAAHNAQTLARIGEQGSLKAAQARNRGLQAAYGYNTQAGAARKKADEALWNMGMDLGGSILSLGAKY